MVTSSSATFASVIAYLIGILNQLVGVLAAAAVLLFMWGAFQYVYKSGKAQQRKTIMWSLLALFILFSIWGILRIACDTFLGSDSCGGTNWNVGNTPIGTYKNSGPSDPGVWPI